ncbi:MAG: VanZ family protein [Actinomyces graevenitzii]|uniref:VanZ family protein n=1 Tax=Actinomyces graevenitzii TaxID=55565 RepID=A0A9E7D6Q5_9ACTO|nr:MAG: VanZ family protein [Actinomyces graevenitzii]
MSQSPLSSSKFASPGAPEASPVTSPNPSMSAQDAPASAQNAAQALQIDNKKSTSTRVKTTLPSRLTWDDQGAMSRLARFLTPPMLLAVIVAVTWPSGAQVAELKENVGPWFLNAIGKDVVLNLIMLLPLGCLVMGGWPKVSPWKWCLGGFTLGALAETIQWLFPALHRRALIDNVFQNGIGACLGVGLALVIMWALQRKSR